MQEQHTAQAITDPAHRSQALTDLTQALSEAGQCERAREVAELARETAQAVTDAHQRARTLTVLAQALASVGVMDLARRALGGPPG